MHQMIFTASLRAARVAIVAGFTLLIAAPAWADQLDLGNAGQSAVVSVGPNASLTINSGPITSSGVLYGDVLVGDNAKSVTLSGGNDGSLPQGLYTDGTTPISGNLQNPFTTFTVPTSVTQSAFNSANSVANFAASLTPTQTFSTINGTQTITGNGGLNVINVGSLSNPKLTISGGANDEFVFNVSGNFQTNQAMTLNGVKSSQILFNFTGTSGNVFQTSGGDTLSGTYLATKGGDFQFSNLNLTGQLINTDGHIQYVSGSSSTFTPPPMIHQFPEPSVAIGLCTTLLGLGVVCLRQRRKAKA